ncbi:MAG TPA: hypothetical protein VG713_12005, partial [Pirellulales bacterium]|nr:hypothetical protein [Pirellulales bacterium]
MRIGITFTAKCNAADDIVCQPGDAALGDAEEEFDSPETVAAIARALESLGHEAVLLGDGQQLVRRLLDEPHPDLVFNFAEGRGSLRSREARVPALLETFGIPYTGSDPLTLAVALDKEVAKRLVRAAGVATPEWVLVDRGLDHELVTALDRLPLPVFVKPAFEGSSKGIVGSNFIADRTALHDTVGQLHQTYQQPILVEEFIEGDELTVGIVGHEPGDVLGIMRVLPRDERAGPFVYSLDVKRDWRRRVRYECPAQLSRSDTHAVRRAALSAWRALGCRDVARIDFRLRDGEAYFLETNPLPGLSPESGDLVLLAQA